MYISMNILIIIVIITTTNITITVISFVVRPWCRGSAGCARRLSRCCSGRSARTPRTPRRSSTAPWTSSRPW